MAVAEDIVTSASFEGVNRESLARSIEALSKSVPTLFCGLNIAQYRALTAAYTKDSEGRIPRTTLITPANMVGKTQTLAQDIVGWCKGSKYLKGRPMFDLMGRLRKFDLIPDVPHGLHFPDVAMEFYDFLSFLRDEGKLVMRICCVSDDMKAGGSVHDSVKEWIPDANFTARDNGGCFRQIEIPHPEKAGIKNVIAVKTFDQDVEKHSGSNCHRVWINEPMPEGIWGETSARARGTKNWPVGSIMMCATVLNQAPYVSDLVDNPRNVHITGAIWENCRSEEVTDEAANDVFIHTGTKLEKNPDGPGYLTYGFLPRNTIEDNLADWKTGSPDEYEARAFGKFVHLSGRVLKIFDRSVHVVKAAAYSETPDDWPVIQIVDPHPRLPDFAGWAVVTPSGRAVFIAEYPAIPYENIKARTETVEQTCETWRRIESELGISKKVVARIGDPNMFLERDARDNQTLQWLYGTYGFHFTLNINDNLDIGLREVNRYLSYDPQRFRMNPRDPLAQPMLMFSDSCPNILKAVERASWRERKDMSAGVSTTIEPKYKHGLDIVRYLCVWLSRHQFADLKAKRDGGGDYEKWKRGHLPKSKRNGSDGGSINTHGRRIVSTSGW